MTYINERESYFKPESAEIRPPSVHDKKEVIVEFMKTNDEATIPTKAHPTDSGFDLYASEDVFIHAFETTIVPTGIAVNLPEGYEAQIRPRSGVTAKTKLRVQLGTIDNGYIGELGVIVDCIYYALNDDKSLKMNLSDTLGYETDIDSKRSGGYIIRKGDRIAQLVIQKLPEVMAVEITSMEDTERGTGGFGSSGIQ